MYVPYINGKCDGPGFPTPDRARQSFTRLLSAHRVIHSVLVIGYTLQAADGTRSEIYDWDTDTWVRSRLDAYGATVLAKQRARKTG